MAGRKKTNGKKKTMGKKRVAKSGAKKFGNTAFGKKVMKRRK
mgnify:CR=1 FL=1|tara:strand:- start:2334 stop:2459 length:126 start_codon:yes stop_codon:yes gene_type:complete